MSSLIPESRPKRRRSLLIIECDHERLVSQNLSMADQFELLSRTVFPRGDVDVVKAISDESLLDDLAKLAEKKYRFKRILAIGHSGPVGINLNATRCASWTEFGRWVSIFQPEQLYLAGCQSGLEKSIDDLCRSLPTVKDVVGSNQTIGKGWATMLLSIMAEPHLRRSNDRELGYQVSQFFSSVARFRFNHWKCC